MDKKSQILRIRAIYRNHKKNLADVQKINTGTDVLKSKIPIEDSNCSVGRWIKIDGQALQSFELFNKIEKQHQRVHQIYRKVYELGIEEIEKDNVKYLTSSFNKLNAIKQGYFTAYCRDFTNSHKKLSTYIKELMIEINKD